MQVVIADKDEITPNPTSFPPEDIVWEEGTWQIIDREHLRILLRYGTLNSILIHRCDHSKYQAFNNFSSANYPDGRVPRTYYTTTDDIDTPCWGCGELPPPTIVTIWMLHR